MSDEKNVPITLPTDLRSLAGAVVFVVAASFWLSSLRSEIQKVSDDNNAQDHAIVALSKKVDDIPNKLNDLHEQNQRMLDLICDTDNVTRKRGCQQ